MTSQPASLSRTKIGLLLLAYISFISLGLDSMLGVAWPSMRADFSQPLDALGLLLISSTIGYLTTSFFIGRLINRLGIGNLLVFSCFASAIALFGYTIAPAWWVIVAFGVLAGLGSGIMDAGINTYLASEYNEGQMQWLHACFGLGSTLGPVVMTASLAQMSSWRPGYTFAVIIKVILAACFILTLPFWKKPHAQAAAAPTERGLMDYQTSIWDSLREPVTWIGIFLFLLYTGAELTLGNWTYTLLTEGRGISPSLAGLWAGGFWATFTLGRVLAGLYAQRIRLDTLMIGALSLALVGALLFWWNPAPLVSILGVFLTGFAMAPIFPGLVSSTSERAGAHHAANIIGIQISAAGLGGALLPALAGTLARRISLEVIPVMLSVALVGLLALYIWSIRGKTVRS